MTKRIQSLERRLAVTLFDRGRLGMRPTTVARVFYPEARQALVALEQAEAAVIEHREDSDVAVPIAASHTIGEFLLPGWLATFRAGRRAVRFEVDIVNSVAVLAAVREQRAMVGFVEGVDTLAEVESLLVHRDEIVVVVAPAHRWAKRTSLRAQELCGDGYLARERGSGSRAVVDAALAAKGISLAPSLEVASAQSLQARARRGWVRDAVPARRRHRATRGQPLHDPGARCRPDARAARDPRVRAGESDRRRLLELAARPPAVRELKRGCASAAIRCRRNRRAAG